MDDDYRDLTAAAAAGEAGAVARLLELHLDDLRAFVRLRAGAEVRAHESCSDLVQSVCREVLTHAERFRHADEDAFRRWLYTCVLRKVLERRRFHGAGRRDVLRREGLADSALAEGELLSRYGRFSSPSHRAMVADEIERVESAFERLPEEYREVVTLAHVAGLSRAAIALEMDRSEGAVRILLHRAIVRLTSELGEESSGEA